MDVRVAVFLREPLPSIVLPTMDVAASSVHLCRLGDIHGQRVWCLHMLYMMITEHCRKRQSCQPKARAPGIDCNQVLLVPCPACHHSVIDQRMLCSHGACSGDAAPRGGIHAGLGFHGGRLHGISCNRLTRRNRQRRRTRNIP